MFDADLGYYLRALRTASSHRSGSLGRRGCRPARWQRCSTRDNWEASQTILLEKIAVSPSVDANGFADITGCCPTARPSDEAALFG
jgi:hypothetical protein